MGSAQNLPPRLKLSPDVNCLKLPFRSGEAASKPTIKSEIHKYSMLLILFQSQAYSVGER